MERKVLLLTTDWKEGKLWEKNGKAPYTKGKYTEITEWDELKNICPISSIGIYYKKYIKNPFVYIKVKGMEYDSNTLGPSFDFEFIKTANVESEKLISKLDRDNIRLFSTISYEKILEILKDLGEEPPEKWAASNVPLPITWKDYIGNYYLELMDKKLSNTEFEDRIAKLLNALGFNVIQRGYKTPGAYPDGIVSFGDSGDYEIVYDCKNRKNYSPTAEDERAIRKYWEEEKIKNKGNIYSGFIAKSFMKDFRKDIFYVSVESLLYLLSKKLTMRTKFDLSPLKNILPKYNTMDKSIIDTEWVE